MCDDASHTNHGRVPRSPAVLPLVVKATTDPAHQGVQLRGGEDVPLVTVRVQGDAMLFGECRQILQVR